jgi:hypothetical protein
MQGTIGSHGYGRRAAGLLAIALLALGAGACGVMHGMTGSGAQRPAESEFGLGPRSTAGGLYQVTLEPVEPLAKRKLQKLNVRVTDAAGAPIQDASMTVGGGMPEHGHGLPTRPRMTHRVADGLYEIDGVRFSMGGWWELTLAINGSAGADSVTFNLNL